MIKGILAPDIWIQHRIWGRDIVHYAKDELDRISIIEPLRYAVEESSYAAQIVIMHQILENREIIRFKDEGWEEKVFNGHLQMDSEVITATAIAAYITEGRQTHFVAKDRLEEKTNYKIKDLQFEKVFEKGDAIYLVIEGTTGNTCEGSEVEGFLLMRGEHTANDRTFPAVFVIPLAANPQDVPRTPVPLFVIDLHDEDASLLELMQKWPDYNLERIESIEKLCGKNEEDRRTSSLAKTEWFRNFEELSYMKKSMEEFYEGRFKAAGFFRDNHDEASKVMKANAEQWADLLAGAIQTILSVTPVIRYPENADRELVRKATGAGPGSRKAMQRLSAQCLRPYWYYGKEDSAEISQEHIAEINEKQASDDISVVNNEITPDNNENHKIDRRKEKRIKNRRKNRVTVGSVSVSKDSYPESESLENSTEHFENDEIHILDLEEATISEESITRENLYQFPLPETNEPVTEEAREILRLCYRDIPQPGSRDWQQMIAHAMAGIIARRTNLKTAPRESIEAARNRIAASIKDRIASLEETERTFKATDKNNRFLPSWKMVRPSAMRPIEEGDLVQLRSGIIIIVDNDPQLATLTVFPGVDPGEADNENQKILVRAIYEDQRLAIDAFLHDKCVRGYRRVNLDLTNGSVEADDSDEDENAEEFADRCYAIIADVVYGAIETAEAWRSDQAYETFRNKANKNNAISEESLENTASIVSVDSNAEESERAERARAPGDPFFSSWENLTVKGDGHYMGTLDEAEFLLLCSSNASSQKMAEALLEQEGSPLAIAWKRHAKSIIHHKGDVLAASAPSPSEEADLRGLKGKEGILVVKDETLWENHLENIIDDGKVCRTRSVNFLYRIDSQGFSVLALQVDDRKTVSFAQWSRGEHTNTAEEDDLCWYARSLIHSAYSKKQENNDTKFIPGILPIMEVLQDEKSIKRNGPRRIIAQTRIYPERLSEALPVVVEWFTEQRQKFGKRIVLDQREAGKWTIEHTSLERNIRSFWAVTVRNPDDAIGALDIIVQTTLATGVSPRLPALVRRIANATPTRGPDGILRTTAKSIRTKGDVIDLVRDLQSSQRILPVLVMTQSEQGHYAEDPDKIAEKGIGALTVVKIPHHLTYELTDTLGQEYRTFGGAARLFQPGFDPDKDPAHRHPRIMADTAASQAIEAIISRATAATITRYNIPDLFLRDSETKTESNSSEDGKSPWDILAKINVPSTPIEARTSSPRQTAPKSQEPEDSRLNENTDKESPEQESIPLQTEAAIDNDNKAEQPGGTKQKTGSWQEAGSPKAVQETAPSSKPEDFPGEARDQESRKTIGVSRDEISAIIAETIDQKLKEAGLDTFREGLSRILKAIEESKASDPVLPLMESAEIEALREELRKERETINELLDEADAEKRAALAQVQTLRQALNDQRRQAHGDKKAEYPEDLSGLSDWLESNVLPNVVITSKAWRNMRKVDYRDMERLCETLKLLDSAYYDMRAGEKGGREAWEEGLKELRLQDKKQTKLGVSAREGDYHFTHEGEVYLMDRHLRGIESVFNEHDRLLRIYYTWDKEQRRVLIGHMPTHLVTKDS